jgi:hypothetical protein
VLDAIERIGNFLPEPAFLFVLGALAVMVLSAVAAAAGWAVEPIGVSAATGAPPLTARSLLDANGLYYALSSMVDNFLGFPPLGIVLVAMFRHRPRGARRTGGRGAVPQRGPLAARGCGRRVRRDRWRVQREPPRDESGPPPRKPQHRRRANDRSDLRGRRAGELVVHDRVDVPSHRRRVGGDGVLRRAPSRATSAARWVSRQRPLPS